MIRYILLLFLMLDISTHCQTFIVFDKVDLKLHQPPWGDELYLEIAGQASLELQGYTLVAFIYYRSEQIGYRKIFLRKLDNKIEFAKTWGPLNKPTQEVIPGEYRVSIIAKGKNRKKYFTNPEGILKEQLLLVGDRNTGIRYKKEIQKLFQKNIKILDGIFSILHKTAKDKSIPIDDWKVLSQKMAYEISKIRKKMEVLEQRFYPTPYPKTFRNIDNYCTILEIVCKGYIKAYNCCRGSRNIEDPRAAVFYTYNNSMSFMRGVSQEAQKEFQEN